MGGSDAINGLKRRHGSHNEAYGEPGMAGPLASLMTSSAALSESKCLCLGWLFLTIHQK